MNRPDLKLPTLRMIWLPQVSDDLADRSFAAAATI